jgi:indolepyruvate decarboxylase
VTTCDEFDEALQVAEKATEGVFVEVVTDTFTASPLSMELHESVKTLCQ